jgi:hypothetical protein
MYKFPPIVHFVVNVWSGHLTHGYTLSHLSVGCVMKEVYECQVDTT